MIDISSWIRLYRSISFDLFKDRIQFIGLQGSYARDEANENSDIDPVLILDEFTFDDLQNYKSAMESMPASPPLCGFLSGVQELRSWLPGELFQFYYDTIPIHGSLDEIIQKPGKSQAKDAILIGACGIYHGCVYNYTHSRDHQVLMSLFKSSVFTMQAEYFLNSGIFIRKHSELRQYLSREEAYILDIASNLYVINDSNFDFLSRTIIDWASNLIK